MLEMVHWRYVTDKDQLSALTLGDSKRKRDHDGAQVMATKFMETATATRRSYPEDDTCNARFTKMIVHVNHFVNSSQAIMPTAWQKKPVPVKGMLLLDPKDPRVREQFRVLANKAQDKIDLPFGRFAKKVSMYYGKYEGEQLTSALVLTVARMNNVPGSRAVSIDYAVSIDQHHSMSQAVRSIKEYLQKGKTPCVVFAQVVNSETAFSFWKGALTQTRRASVLVAFFHIFDRGYHIYPDVSDFAEFYKC